MATYTSEHTRFKVIKTQDSVVISGTLNETTELQKFRDLFSGCSKVDLSKLSLATWSGLRYFYIYLQSFSRPISIQNISYSLFLQSLVFIEEFPNIRFDSFHIFVSANENSILVIDDLVKIHAKDSDFFRYKDSETTFDLRLILKKISAQQQFRAANINALKNSDAVVFLNDYVYFLFTTADACRANVCSLGLLLQERIAAMGTKINGFTQGLKSISACDLNFDFQSMQNTIAENFEILNNFGREISRQIENILFKLHSFALTSEQQESVFYKLIEDLVSVAQNITNLASRFESVGSELIIHLISIPAMSELRRWFESVDKTAITPAQTKELCQTFNVMNFMCEDDVDLLFEEVLLDVAHVEQEHQNCVVEMQQLDGNRQILEHRFVELELLQNLWPALQEKAIDLNTLKTEITEKAYSKLVTDMEKYAFRYYFGEMKVVESDSMSKGEINFF